MLHTGVPWWGRWIQSRHQTGGSRALCFGGSLAIYLKPKWCDPGVFWGALHLCHLGTMAGAVLSTNQGYPCGHCSVATLLGWLGMMWATVLWLTEAKQTKLVPKLCTGLCSQGGLGRRGHVYQPLPPRDCSSSSLTIWWSPGGGSFICSIMLF